MLTKIATELCEVVQDDKKKNQILLTIKEITNKEDKTVSSPNLSNINCNEMEIVDTENKKNENEIIEKRKEQRTPCGCNIKQDDLTGKITFNYAEIGQLTMLRKRRVNDNNANE